MTRAAVFISFLAAFAIAICVAALVARGIAGNEPIYRLDAAYHHLPPKLVAELLAHPPKRPWLGPNIRCQYTDIDGEQIGYCICFGREACAEAPRFPMGRTPGRDSSWDEWECKGPLGIIDDRGTAVCHADLGQIIAVG